jgi:hypothetical protein
MASFYTSQAYDASAPLIWSILTDFTSWPRWFPNMATLEFEDGHIPGAGAQLVALADDRTRWSRWRILDWKDSELLVCEFDGTNSLLSQQVQHAYLKFGLLDEPEGSTLDVEIGAEGSGIVGDLLVGTTLGFSARRMLPKLVDAFTDHVIECVSGMP